jgi:hypothetical protein
MRTQSTLQLVRAYLFANGNRQYRLQNWQYLAHTLFRNKSCARDKVCRIAVSWCSTWPVLIGASCSATSRVFVRRCFGDVLQALRKEFSSLVLIPLAPLCPSFCRLSCVFYLFMLCQQYLRGHCYKPEGRGFDSLLSWPNPSSRTMALGSTQPLTEMRTRNIPGGKGRPARKADNLTVIFEPTV